MASSPLALPGAVLPAVTVGASGEAAPNADFSALLADAASATALPPGLMAMPSPGERSPPLPLEFTPAREPKSGRTGMPGGNTGKNLPDGKLPPEPDAAPLDSAQERRADTLDSARHAAPTSHASAEEVMASAPAPRQAPAPSPEVASPPATTSLLMSQEQRTNPEMPSPGTSASRPIVRAPRDQAPARSQLERPSRPDVPSPQAVASKPRISSARLPTNTTVSRAVPAPPGAMATRQPTRGGEPVPVTSEPVVTPAQQTAAQQPPTHDHAPLAIRSVSAAIVTPAQQSTTPVRPSARGGTSVAEASAAFARPRQQLTGPIRQPSLDGEPISTVPESTTTPAQYQASPLPLSQAGDRGLASLTVPVAGHEAGSTTTAPVGTPTPDRRAALLASTAPLVPATVPTDVADATAAPTAQPMVLAEQGTSATPPIPTDPATRKDAPAPEPIAPAADAEPASQVIPVSSKPTPAWPELQARRDIAALTQPQTAVAPARTEGGQDAATPTIAPAPQSQSQSPAASPPAERTANPAAPTASAPERSDHKAPVASSAATSEPAPAPIHADVPLAAAASEPRAAAMPIAVTTSDATPQPTQDLAALVDRIAEARAAAAPQMVRAALMHEDFGAVSLNFRSEDSHLHVTLSNDDPGFAPAVHAAAATSLAGQNRDDQTRRDGQPQQHSAAAREDGSASNTAAQQQTQQHFGRDRSAQPERAAPRDTTPRQPAGERPQTPSSSQQRRGGIYA